MNDYEQMAVAAQSSMTQSQDIGALVKALSAVQGKMGHALKSSKNPFFNSNYADLAECLDTVRPLLSENGLAVIQTTGFHEQGVAVITTLAHSSGQWIRGTVVMPPSKKDPQSYGSAITYGRRYGLSAIVGLAQDDDDGNAASGRPTRSVAADSKATTPLGKIKSTFFNAKYCGISKDDIDTADQVVEWLTDGEYPTFSDATKDDHTCEHLLDAMTEKLKTEKVPLTEWVNKATTRGERKRLDSEFKEVVG